MMMAVHQRRITRRHPLLGSKLLSNVLLCWKASVKFYMDQMGRYSLLVSLEPIMRLMLLALILTYQ